MSRRVALLCLIALGIPACAALQQESVLRPDTASTVVAVTRGQVRDALTQMPVAGARVQAGSAAVLSDVQGSFSLPVLRGDTVLVTAKGYEGKELVASDEVPVAVSLAPDPATTLQTLYLYEQRREFSLQYDLLHPDVQELFTRDEYVRFMERERPFDLMDYTVGAPQSLPSGVVLGQVYANVAQVPVQATVRTGVLVEHRAWMAYLTKHGNLWRWLRGPLMWPTPTLTATPAPSPTSVPTLTETLTLPVPTATPHPTLTLYPLASPSPYEPIVPGSQAVVASYGGALHTGPGQQYAVTTMLPRGVLVWVMDWPSWVAGLPWYRVRVQVPAEEGWCDGAHLVPLVPKPTSVAPSPTLSPATGPIAFTSDRDGDREVYVMNPDGTGQRNLSQNLGQDGDPAWAPGRDRLVFVSDRYGSNDLFVMDADGGGQNRLTVDPTQEIHPAWSPTGAMIAYVSNQDGDWEIFVLSTTGAGAVQLTHNVAWDSFPAWSPDGQKLVFTSDRDGNYELYTYDLLTRDEARLTTHPASDAFPAWAPSGTEIAFTSAREGRLELYLLELTAGPQRVTRLTHSLSADAANRYPTWSSDGNWLAFTSWRDGNAEVYVIGRDGAALWNLTRNGATDEAPAWAK